MENVKSIHHNSTWAGIVVGEVMEVFQTTISNNQHRY
jgi:hypothetical protein